MNLFREGQQALQPGSVTLVHKHSVACLLPTDPDSDLGSAARFGRTDPDLDLGSQKKNATII